jgi:hypothetical protein
MEAHTLNRLKGADRKIAHWRHNPISFVREVFGAEPDDWQADFLTSYNNNTRTAAKAAKGCGKTTGLSWAAWHFLLTRPFPKIAATSITGDNLRDGLWSEMAKWQHRSPLLTNAFTWTAHRIYANDHPEVWWMAARRWSKDASGEQQANTLAGLHADYIMFMLDESGGIPDAVMAAAEAALSSGIECKLLQTGNPTHLTGPLYRACTTERSYWHVIEITGDPDDPKRSKRISIDWARKQIHSYGRDNPWVLVNVFGRFPPQSLNALIGPDEMRDAMKRMIPLEAYRNSPRILGIDVACEGDDATVIFPHQGLVKFKPKVLRVPDLVQVAGHCANAIIKFKPDAVFVDSTGGFGKSVCDNLNNWGYNATPIHFSMKAQDNQYVNKRVEMAVEFVRWIKGGGCLPDVPELVEEATKMSYFFKGDQLQLIGKDQLKEELHRSSDYFDAAMLCHAFPVIKRDPLHGIRARNEAEYNPVQRHFSQSGNQKVDDYNPIA